MINYTDIIREAYEDNHINFIDYFHSKEKKSIKNQRIEAMFFEWFLAKAQVIERDFFINIDTFIPNCLNQCQLAIRGLANSGSDNKEIVDLSFMLLALEKMNKTMDEADQQGGDTPKHKGENMELELLDDLFIPNMTAGAHPTKLEQLKGNLRSNVCHYNGRKITALANVIYESGVLHKNIKPKEFSKWLVQFCKIIDYTLPQYKPNAVSKEYRELKETYYYLIP